MQLPQVDVVDAEPVQRPVQVLTRAVGAPLAGLGGQEEPAGVRAQPRGHAPLRLAVAVAGGDVDVVDVVLEQRLEGAVGGVLRDAGERGRAEDQSGAAVAGAPEREARDGHDTSG